jgi:orotidine-5'-phosphate decarboxylase
MSERIIVALDLPTADEAGVLAAALRGRARRVKVGLTLFSSEGPRIVERLTDLGLGVFVDLKLHDIPHQVDGAVRALAALGVEMLTVHAAGGLAMMRAAVAAADEAAREDEVTRPSVLAVTVLTSLDVDDMRMIGVEAEPREQVLALTRLAAEAGVDGIVCSPREAPEVREILGPDALVVTPGVRPAWSEVGDQSRVATPAAALAGGASHLVIGRPITEAVDPADAFDAIAAEMEEGPSDG